MGRVVDTHSDLDVLVVGAGIAGLLAAERLTAWGRNVLVLEKSRGVGGRMATRRIGEAVFDHGAQFFTVRDPVFAEHVERWREAGAAGEWFRTERGDGEAHLRWRGVPGMTAPAKLIANGLAVRLQSLVVSVECAGDLWKAVLDDGTEPTARAVLLTSPVPQSLALIEAGGFVRPPEIDEDLSNIVYDRCIAVIAVLDRPPELPETGVCSPGSGIIAWIADNRRKGVSPVPALTIHATPEFSLANWDRNRTESGSMILEAAASRLRGEVVEFQVHGWRYARPRSTYAKRFAIIREAPMLLLAGDAFGAPRVEGAARSGLDAAEAIEARLRS